MQIQCPADCAYLASAREHPAAVVVRQQQRDVAFVAQAIRDLGERQAELFFMLATRVIAYEPPELQPLIDDDVAEALSAMAGTLETASRGVIYDHRPASLPAERLVAALKPLVAEAGRGLGSSFERDAAAVMRKLAEMADEVRAHDPGNRRALLELLTRVLARGPAAGAGGDAGDHDAASAAGAPETSRLIVP